MTQYDPICVTCRHNRGGLKCAAFPQGIPTPILTKKADHRKPYPGDNGIRYEPMQGKK